MHSVEVLCLETVSMRHYTNKNILKTVHVSESGINLTVFPLNNIVNVGTRHWVQMKTEGMLVSPS